MLVFIIYTRFLVAYSWCRLAIARAGCYAEPSKGAITLQASFLLVYSMYTYTESGNKTVTRAKLCKWRLEESSSHITPLLLPCQLPSSFLYSLLFLLLAAHSGDEAIEAAFKSQGVAESSYLQWVQDHRKNQVN